MQQPKRKLGLSLSGGGYRASAFHLGTLNKLNEMGLLDEIDILSTISGGSITGAAWCLSNDSYDDFHQKTKATLESKSVIKYILTSAIFLQAILLTCIMLGGAIYLTFTDYAPLSFPLLILFIFILLKFQYQIFPVSRTVEQAYEKFFYQQQTLKDFNSNRPVIAIGSSNLHTGRPFTFSQNRMSDSAYSAKDYQPPITFNAEHFPVARAVAASSCVPFAFSPVFIDPSFYTNPFDIARAKPVLIDGGVYDNQGIHKLTQSRNRFECEIIITSDAGGNFKGDKVYPNVISLLTRTVDLFMYRIKASQMQQNIYRNVENAAKPIAYFSLGWTIDRLIPGFVDNLIAGQVLTEVLEFHRLDPLWINSPALHRADIETHLRNNTSYDGIATRGLTQSEWDLARKIGTNLTSLSSGETDLLIRHAENLTELQIKLYCPMLLNHTGHEIQ